MANELLPPTGDASLNHGDDPIVHLRVGRKETIDALRRRKRVDALVVGGGIHGACIAHLLAFNGVGTVLLERDDFAFHTSSRSSKMIHGGLRYLEFGDLRQVYEGVQARKFWLSVAPHLVRWQTFLIPIAKGNWFQRVKLSWGLRLYRFLSGFHGGAHSWIPAGELPKVLPQDNYSGALAYRDAVMDDTRLVLDVLGAARQEGAVTLNRAEVVSITTEESQDATIEWHDNCTRERHTLRAGVVINCAGPWAPWLGRPVGKPESGGVRYSRGAHLWFDVAWKVPPLLFPLPGQGTYYWVWPWRDGALVGTTEHEVTELEVDPLPRREEVDEILRRLAHDLPGSGLAADSVRHGFSGVRTIVDLARGGPQAYGKKSVSALSRGHLWSWHRNLLTLRGGKYTTAPRTAEEGARMVWERGAPREPLVAVRSRMLPGAEGFEEYAATFTSRASERGVPPQVVERVISVWGGLVRYILELRQGCELIGGSVLRGEIELAASVEQAQSLSDLVHRRLMLDEILMRLSEEGQQALLGALAEVFAQFVPCNPEREVASALERMRMLREVLGPRC